MIDEACFKALSDFAHGKATLYETIVRMQEHGDQLTQQMLDSAFKTTYTNASNA